MTAAARRRALALAILGLCAAAGFGAEPPTPPRQIVVGGDFNYEPFEWLDEQGAPRGFHVDLMKAMAEELGFEVTFRLDAWDQVRKEMDRGRIDVVPMFRSAERDPLVDFAEPHAILSHQLFVRSGTTTIHSPADLRGRTVIVQRGAFAHDRLRTMESGARLVPVATEEDALRLLASGRHDAALVSGVGGRGAIERDDLSDLTAAGSPFWPVEYALAVRKDDTELLDLLNQGLAALRANGRYDEIYRRWLPGPDAPSIGWRTALRYSGWVLAPLVLLAFASLAWTWTLRRQVAARTRDLEREAGERSLVERELLQAQKMEAVGRLAGGVAHDFNNLLTVILGESDFALADSTVEGTARTSIEEIRSTAERGAALTRQLLAFSRRDLVEPTVFRLSDAVENVSRMLTRLCGQKIHMKTRLAADGGAVRADRGQLEQVLVNLVINSCHAMPQGGELVIETASVELEEGQRGSAAELPPGPYELLMVSDTGGGMSREVRSRLFEPFFTTKPAGQGSGLGLASCQRIARQAGGDIDVYSEEGVGTTMKVYLPRAGGPEIAPPLAASKPFVGGSETVLLVDDEPAIRRVAERILRQAGYVVLQAEGGSEALLMLKAEPDVALLLTDVVLPRMGGRQLAERAQAIRPQLRVLFASGYADDVILQRRLLEPDAALLHKPFTRRTLLAAVRKILDTPS